MDARRILTLAALAALAALSCAAGCSIPDVNPAPLDSADDPAPEQPSSSASSTKKSNKATSTTSTGQPTPASSAPSSIDTTTPTTTTSSSAKSLHWTGTVGQTDAVPFGSEGYCSYSVTLSDIAVDVGLEAQGNISSSTVTTTMTESTPACDQPAKGALPLRYAYSSATSAPVVGLLVGPVADPRNRPQGTLALTGTMVSASTMHVALDFHRDDEAEPLDWTVSAELDLSAQP